MGAPHSKPKKPSYDRPSRIDPKRAPLPPGRDFSGPGRGRLGPEYYRPGPDSPRNRRPSTRQPRPASPVHRNHCPLFEEIWIGHRKLQELYKESSWRISPNNGTDYLCTHEDLDACGGKYRRTSKSRDNTELRALWFSRPNQRDKVSVRQAALDVVRHNNKRRTPSAKEHEAIERLLAMLDRARHGFWGPDVAIKSFCDLDTVFFRGELRDHVCVTWAGPKWFPGEHTFGHTRWLGEGKALIQLNAHYIFFGQHNATGRPINQTFATMLHEMIHAHQMVNCQKDGKNGLHAVLSGPSNGHGKNFGSMMNAVNKRALRTLGLKGDSTHYPRHHYEKGEGLPLTA